MEATHDDVRFAVERRLVEFIDAGSFPRPLTIYAGYVENVSCWVPIVDLASMCLTLSFDASHRSKLVAQDSAKGPVADDLRLSTTKDLAARRSHEIMEAESQTKTGRYKIGGDEPHYGGFVLTA